MERMKLKDIPYERIDFDDIKIKMLELIESQKNAKSGKEQFAIHQKYYELSDRVQTMAALAMFRHSINTEDEYYDKENDYYDNMMPQFISLDIEYQDTLYNSPYRDYLEDVIGKVAFKNIELQKKAHSEKTIELSQKENQLTSEYEKLLASAVFDWDGESISMAQLGKYKSSTDRKVRKRAWKMHNDFMKENAEKFDKIYDELVKNRTKQAQIMGYKNYTELAYYRMQRNCYDRNMVENFRSQVKKYLVPYTVELHKKRAERIGVDDNRIYDEGVYFKNGNPKPEGTPDEILAAGLKMYEELSDETAVFMKDMMKYDMFDVLGRKNKMQGGYMELLAMQRMPLIFANFNGTSGDVDVITHECGHAFQYYIAGQDDIREHWDITMETAETHSMSMEFFTNPWMDKFFGERAGDFKKMQLEDAICFIPYGCMVDEFQHIVYDKPWMTPKERHDAWNELEKIYRPYLDSSDLDFFAKGGWWQKQHHIYSSPFYYIDYCLAQTCALQYRIMMYEDYDKAWKSYLDLCRKSASGFFTDMIKEAGLISPFEDGCIENIVNKEKIHE